MAENVLINDVKPVQSPDGVSGASQLNQEGSSVSVLRETEVDDLHRRQNPDCGGTHSAHSCQDGSSIVSVVHEKEFKDIEKAQSPSTSILASETDRDGSAVTTVPGNAPHLDTSPMTQSDQEKSALPVKPEKVLGKLPLRRNPDIMVPALYSVQDGKHLSKVLEKPSEDGYNWRKYGQKLVRGNQFVRSYYKCTYPNCPSRKLVERSHEGKITNTEYRGEHEHSKPQQSPQVAVPIQARRLDKPSLANAAKPEAESSNFNQRASHQIVPVKTPKLSTVETNVVVMEGATPEPNKTSDEDDCDEDPDSKRRRRNISSVDNCLALPNRINVGSRLVIKTTSLVDIVNDGYRWRKYGQKLVKGNPNPRSYYRCSSTGCPVKKHVERAFHDPKVVITTYEGQHSHEIPSSRTVTQNTPGNDADVKPQNGGSRTEPEETEAVCLDMVVHVGAN